ncbi:hypothetical protein DFH08DRAFT_901693 [Mycena albidolilacea]|uniref:DUF6818 domain-containing protein n=1 Tax=Mycena albidolilacea TaxID=1033008 RepID=A0AAD7EAS9_9AGAR|nr:hypothetical protein DFH08DRAFT_901693 [Mycena albidolilacea]
MSAPSLPPFTQNSPPASAQTGPPPPQPSTAPVNFPGIHHAAKCGRHKGLQNWSKNDTSKLFDLVEKHLPLGQKGWKLVIAAFFEWADVSGRPARDGKAIEGKYKMLLKTKKPTGDAHCPPEIKRAYQIKSLINEKADTREISNDSV